MADITREEWAATDWTFFSTLTEAVLPFGPDDLICFGETEGHSCYPFSQQGEMRIFAGYLYHPARVVVADGWYRIWLNGPGDDWNLRHKYVSIPVEVL